MPNRATETPPATWKSQWAQDLEWAIHSPSLIAPDAEDSFAPLHQNRPRTGAPPTPDAAGEWPPPHRVGKYFESLIHAHLEATPSITLVAYGHQIRSQKQTLGELDFVFRDAQGELNHWETAVKFYLYDADHRILGSHYIGPNTSDTFERKMARLFDHQLTLGHDHLPNLKSSKAIVRGRIFYHPDQALPESLPPYLSKHHLKGDWVRQGELEAYCAQFRNARYQLLPKPFWLSPITPTGIGGTNLTAGDLQSVVNNHFQSSAVALVFAVVQGEQESQKEMSRCFVVDERWPEQG